MRELSLHILDLLENSVQAGASVIAVAIIQQPERDFLMITIDDNGPGLSVSPDVALDPFYTTKHGKKTGLGLSLFKFRAEQAGGDLTLEKSALGGLAVHITMQLRHVDRSPLGDFAATCASIVCTNPEVDVRCVLRNAEREWNVSVADITHELPPERRHALVIASLFEQRIRQGLLTLGMQD